MKHWEKRALQSAVLMLGGLALVLSACFGSGGEGTGASPEKTSAAARTTTVTTASAAVSFGPADPYSTFRSKDPFIQQAQPPSTTSTTQAAPTSTVSSTTSTTSSSSTTTSTATTSTTASTTTTTSFFAHLLQVLSVTTYEGGPAVTFQVDNTVYRNHRVGDVVSTSWGQIKVLEIDTVSKVVKLLHGSETLELREGQIVYE